MKLITTLTLLILISGCAVAGLAKTAVTTTVKVAEVPFKVIGSIVAVSYTHLTLPTKA